MELNDFCHFRYEIDVKQGFEDVDFILDVDLMFFDTSNNNNYKNENA